MLAGYCPLFFSSTLQPPWKIFAIQRYKPFLPLGNFNVVASLPPWKDPADLNVNPLGIRLPHPCTDKRWNSPILRDLRHLRDLRIFDLANFCVVHRVVVSKRTLLVCCCCILYSFDNRGRSLECESRGESHESENCKWEFRSIQMEFLDTKWTRYFQ